MSPISNELRIAYKHSFRGNEHYNHLLGIGGVDAAGLRWYRTEAEAIANLESGRESYHVLIDGTPHNIVIATIKKKGFTHRYLKCASDKLKPNGIINLPEIGDSH